MNGQGNKLTEVIQPVRWVDLDPLGHVNHAVYLSYLEESRNAWFEKVTAGDLGPDSYVVARLEIDYLNEITVEAGTVSCCCRAVELGSSSLITDEALVMGSGATAARARAVAVLWNPELRSSRKMTQAERLAFDSGGVVGEFPSSGS